MKDTARPTGGLWLSTASSAALSYDLDGYGDSTHLLLDYSVNDVGSGITVIEREASLRLVDGGGVTTWTLNFLEPIPRRGTANRTLTFTLSSSAEMRCSATNDHRAPERDGCVPFRSRALTKPTTAKIALIK